MNSVLIRQKFLDFFHSRGHTIVSSAPMVIKDDPTLMFTNAGMNQFKEIFLDNAPVISLRIANTQKCLRVSGKHNDLEEVGHDGYHHTMFEMLGNWSFGDYFKKEAISWAWEFLVDEMGIASDRLYATVFEGSKEDDIEMDREAFHIWKEYLPENHILTGSKKDNFWEMGDTGPCGPCSEVHVDLRTDEERQITDGRDLVNKGDPKVIEIWNLVFIQFNRKTGGKLFPLSKKHVDTGMGFERLCMVLQGKTSNYDTDVFQPVLLELGALTGFKYGESEKTDIAMRVVADHLRAISFAIADGQLPSNNKAGYVIRRILRRAVRYNFTFLKQNKPVLFKLVHVLAATMGNAFPELVTQKQLIERVIREEEQSFLHTLESGMRLLDQIMADQKKNKNEVVSGKIAFELYDTYGFPLDLTELVLKENNMVISHNEFETEMRKQRERSKSAASTESGDWEMMNDGVADETFIGYDSLTSEVKINRYRKVISKDHQVYHLVFNVTPFYAESGGQVGDTGFIEDGSEKIQVLNTIREHGLIIHVTETLPHDPHAVLKAFVNGTLRNDTAKNHSATHLLHYALREVLGKHVEQKGSLVCPDYLRFDFSHFQRVTDEELLKIERIVNKLIREGLERNELRDVPMDEAKKLGAMALFGEKYGDKVRVIRFGDSVELCGGTHVKSTSQIGLFKITSEGSIAAGIRRIEAITGEKAEEYFYHLENTVKTMELLLNKPQDLVKSVSQLIEEKTVLQKQVERFTRENIKNLKSVLLSQVKTVGDINLIAGKYDGILENAALLKDIAFQLKGEVDNLFFVMGAVIGDKPYLVVMISENLVKEKKLHAGDIVKEAAKEFDGGGGGQQFLATAGGKSPEKLDNAINRATEFAINAGSN